MNGAIRLVRIGRNGKYRAAIDTLFGVRHVNLNTKDKEAAMKLLDDKEIKAELYKLIKIGILGDIRNGYAGSSNATLEEAYEQYSAYMIRSGMSHRTVKAMKTIIASFVRVTKCPMVMSQIDEAT